MPELPEVETVRRGLNQLTLGQRITGGKVLLDRSLAPPLSPSDFARTLAETQITLWQRRGKYLLARISSGGWLGVHLRMSGQLLWLRTNDPLQKHTRIRIFFEGDRELRFVDTRTFGKIWWVAPRSRLEEIITGLQKLGPEPLSSDFSEKILAQKSQKSRRCIKSLLLDQSVVAGIGNIYADEVLFKSKIKPDSIAAELNLEQIQAIHVAIKEVLQTAIDLGGTSFSDFLNVSGVNGNYGGSAWVYGRNGQPCKVCSTIIAKIKLNGRSAHFCPQCQR